MQDDRSVKPRRYESPKREAAARATRRRILDAAHEELATHGYAATTMRAIAERADVSVKTVEAAFGTKANLIKELIDVCIAGDDEPVAISDREIVAEMIAEPDPVVMLRMNARMVADISRRLVVVSKVIEAAGPELDDLRAAALANRREGARAMVEVLRAKAPLRVDVEAAVDTVWLLMDSHHYDQLTTHLGWSHEDYVDWLFDVQVRLLVRQDPTA